MANALQIKRETMAIVDAAMTIANKFPELQETDTELSFNISTNPFTFLMDLFKSTSGYDKTISIIGRFIAKGLPLLEASVKALLIAKLKDIISCSVNPFFTDEILREGITFNVEEIDIADILKYSPLDSKVGKFFYFDNEDIEYPDDLKFSDDMNAFIWFMVNRANRRYVWKPKKNRKDAEFRDNYPEDGVTKRRKEDGIITLEYYEKPNNLLDSYGQPFLLQTPYFNCLHVFIGDTRQKKDSIGYDAEDDTTLTPIEKKLYDNNIKIRVLNNKLEHKKQKLDKLQTDEREKISDALTERRITAEEYKSAWENNENQIVQLQGEIANIEGEIETKQKDGRKWEYKIGELANSIQNAVWEGSSSKYNYYYGKTLIQFNIDYITSLKIFDEKALTAQLLDAITGVLSVNLHLTYKQQLIKNEVKRMVRMINESDDLVVSDCFFTFSNDMYDSMSRQAELRKAGLVSIDGNETSAVKVNAEEIMSKLNELNKETNKEVIQTVIEGTLTDISKELTDTTYEYQENINFGAQMYIIENLLNSLAYVIVCAVLSPKVYLLLLINLRIIGRTTNFDLKGFLESYSNLIAELIRSIRDQILKFFLDELMILIRELALDVTIKLSIEQAKYYSRLIKKLIECFKRFKKDIDFDVANVDYADILDSEEEPKNNEC